MKQENDSHGYRIPEGASDTVHEDMDPAGYRAGYKAWKNNMKIVKEPSRPDVDESKLTKEQKSLYGQYKAMKAKHPGAMLLFRCGDFYEAYMDDARKLGDILGITVTRRNGTDLLLAGFPHHALDVYLPKLIRAGERVGICDQLELPKKRQPAVSHDPTTRIRYAGGQWSGVPEGVKISGLYEDRLRPPHAFLSGDADPKSRVELIHAPYGDVIRVHTFDEHAETPRKMHEILEQEGYAIEEGSNYSSGYADFETYKEAEDFLKHVEEVQTRVDDARKSKEEIRPGGNVEGENHKSESIPTNLNETETMEKKKNAEQQAQQAKESVQAQVQAAKQKATQEQAKAEQSIRDARQKAGQKAADASTKEEKKEEQKARRLATAAVVGAALGAALADGSRGVFLNRDAKEAPAINGGKIPLTPFNTAVLAAVADQKGYRTSQFVTFDETLARGASVRKGQKGVGLEWDSTKYTNPSLPKDDEARTLSRSGYNALPADAQKSYIPRQTTTHLSVFNIDQTMMQHAEGERYSQVVESAGPRGETRESILAAIVAKEDKEPDKKGQVSLYKEPDGNYYAYGRSAGILQEKLSSDTSITITPEEVKVSIGPAGKKQQAGVPRVGISADMMPGVVEQLVKSGAHVALDDRYSVPQEPKVDAKAALKSAIAQAKEVMKTLGGKVEMTKGSDEVGLSPTDRNTLLVGRLSKGSTVTAGLAKTADVYRGIVDALTDRGRVNTYRNTLLHNDKPVFKALIQELSAATLMVRAGLPAAISGRNRALVPQWQEMLSSNPGLVESLGKGVNRVVGSYDRLAAGQSVNFAIVNGDNKKYYNKYSIANGIAALAAGSEAVAVADKKHNALDVVADSRMTAAQQELIRSRSLDAGYKDVRFFTSRGGGALVQPNEYFAGSQAALLTVGENDVKVKKEIDLTSLEPQAERADLHEMHAYKAGNQWAFLIRPRDGEAFSVYPSAKDRSIYFNARQGLKAGTVTSEQFAATMEALNQRNYRAAMAKPELQQHILIPKVDGAVTSQVERAFQKRGEDGGNLLVARIGGKWMSAPLDNARSSRKFLFADNVAGEDGTTHLRLDKDAVQKYNTSLALDVFMDKLTLTDAQRSELSAAFHPEAEAPEPVQEEKETVRAQSHRHM